MTINAQEIGAFPPFEIANPFTVDAGLPVTVHIAVALTAKAVRFGEIDKFTICKLQFITVGSAMAIKTPSFLLGMMQFDVRMFIFQFPALGIHVHAGMAVAAGENPRRKGGGAYGKLAMLTGRQRKTGSHNHERYK